MLTKELRDAIQENECCGEQENTTMNPSAQSKLKVLVDHGVITEHGLEWIKTKGSMNPNDPAFPQPHHYCAQCGALQPMSEGPSLLAEFAGRAMQGLLSNKAITQQITDCCEGSGRDFDGIAVLAVAQADALINELNKKVPHASQPR